MKKSIYIASVVLASGAAMAMSPDQVTFNVRCGNTNIVTTSVLMKEQNFFYNQNGAIVSLPLSNGQSCVIPWTKLDLRAECFGPANSLVMRSTQGIYTQPRVSQYQTNHVGIGPALNSNQSAESFIRITRSASQIEFAASKDVGSQFASTEFMSVGASDKATACEIHPFTWSDSSGC